MTNHTYQPGDFWQETKVMEGLKEVALPKGAMICLTIMMMQ